MQPSARKPHRDWAGYLSEKRNKLSGGHNVISDCKLAADQGTPIVADWKEEGGRYQVVCNEHGTLVYTTNMPSARDCMKDATSFCDICRVLAGEHAPDHQFANESERRMYFDSLVKTGRAKPGASCGHSVCSQNFIDTGETDCIDEYDPTPYETSSGADPADTIRDSQVEAMRYKR